jgi:hypothetical protein
VFVACGQKSGEKTEEKEVNFCQGVIPIRMVTPNNWTMNYSYYFPNVSHYSTESYSKIHIDNSLFENVHGDKGLSFTLESPCYIGSKDVETIIPDFETFQKHKCGNSIVYVLLPTKIGYVYFDGKYLIHFQIDHWPKDGITPEMESFFSSLHVD